MAVIERWAKAVLPEKIVAGIRAGRRGMRHDAFTSARIRRDLYAFLKLNTPPDRIVLREGLSLAVNEPSKLAFHQYCWKVPEAVTEFDRFVELARGRSHFLDVGSGHGIYSLAFCALNPQGRVIAIDPSDIAREVFADNIERNGFGERIAFLDCAAGVSGGVMRAQTEWHHVAATVSADAPLSIEMRSIDEICQSHDFRPEIVKVDVEGFELEVLRGAQGVLAGKPMLLLEMHPDRVRKLGHRLADIYALLAGYTIRDMDGVVLSEAAFTRRKKGYNLIAAP